MTTTAPLCEIRDLDSILMKSIYIVGAQCTGKTTLTEAVSTTIKKRYLELEVEVINEMARSVLERHNFTREDVREGSERCMSLQKLILDAQYNREMELDARAVLVSDRSGIDPLAYASVFAKDQSTQGLSDCTSWQELKVRMRSATVVVCEPVEDWLIDDGVRLMPVHLQEWREMHQVFCQLLESHGIPYSVLPSSLLSLPARVDLVLEWWKQEG